MSAETTTTLHERDVLATPEGIEVDDIAVTERRRVEPDDFSARLGRAARENPAAAALITMGAVWLFAGGARTSILGRRKDAGTTGNAVVPVVPPGYALVPAGTVAGSTGGSGGRGGTYGAAGRSDLARDAAGNVVDAAGNVVETAGDLAARLRGGVASAAGAAADATVDGVSALGDAASGVASGAAAGTRALGRGIEGGIDAAESAASYGARMAAQAADAAGRTGTALVRGTRSTALETWDDTYETRENVRRFFEERPLAVGLLSAAAGIGLAVALPRTRVEDELVGERSDALKREVRDAVAERVASARDGADEALARLVRDARARGLSSSAIAAAVDEFTAKLEKVGTAAVDAADAELAKAR